MELAMDIGDLPWPQWRGEVKDMLAPEFPDRVFTR
jgi:hypothetical protein